MIPYNVMNIIAGFISLLLTVWFVIFTVLVIKKLDKIVEILNKKQ